MPGRQPAPRQWTAESIALLRDALGLSQAALARELGVRQQTVSEWETGRYAPRGASARLLTIFAEQRSGYGASPADAGPGSGT